MNSIPAFRNFKVKRFAHFLIAEDRHLPIDDGQWAHFLKMSKLVLICQQNFLKK